MNFREVSTFSSSLRVAFAKQSKNDSLVGVWQQKLVPMKNHSGTVIFIEILISITIRLLLTNYLYNYTFDCCILCCQTLLALRLLSFFQYCCIIIIITLSLAIVMRVCSSLSH